MNKSVLNLSIGVTLIMLHKYMNILENVLVILFSDFDFHLLGNMVCIDLFLLVGLLFKKVFSQSDVNLRKVFIFHGI